MIHAKGEGWTYTELALAIGLRAMGEDYNDIGMRLDRIPDDVARTLHKARNLLRAENWIEPLLADTRTARANLPEKRAVRVQFPAYRVKRNVPRLAAEFGGRRDLTGYLMGDPAPERSALHEKGTSK